MKTSTDSFSVRDLRQAKLLADPFRLRLIQLFAAGPGTVKGAADALGEPVSRLYRHVHALHKAGLLKVVSRRRVRGVTERRYQAVARRFEFDHDLLAGGGAKQKQQPSRRLRIAVQLVEQARDRLASLADDSCGVVMRAQFHATREEIAEIQAELSTRFEKLSSKSRRSSGERIAWSATIALCPSDDLP